MSGELGGGVKLSHCQRVLMDGVKTNRLMIQGTEGRDANADGSTDGSFAITVRRLIVDKRRGEGRVSDESNGVQVSWHVTGLVVESFSILAGGSNGNAIQLAGGCEASFRGGVISGFNQLAGTAPAYAAEVLDGSTLNTDFETANQFYDQARLVRVG